MAGPKTEHVVSLTTSDGRRHRVVQERHPSKSYGAQFVILFTDAMERAAQQIRGGTTLRVLLVLPRFLNFTDYKRLPTAEVAQRVEADQSGVTRAMRELLALGIVEREGLGPYTMWRLSSDWGWNGTADQWHAHQAGRLKGKKPPARAPEVSGRRMHNAVLGPDMSTAENKQQPAPSQTRLTLLGVVAGQGAK